MRLEAIAPGQYQDAGEDRRIDEVRCADRGIAHPSGKRREHNTLCHRISALWLGGDDANPIS